MFSTLWVAQEILEITGDDEHEFCQCDLRLHLFLKPPDLQPSLLTRFAAPKAPAGMKAAAPAVMVTKLRAPSYPFNLPRHLRCPTSSKHNRPTQIIQLGPPQRRVSKRGDPGPPLFGREERGSSPQPLSARHLSK